MGTKTTKLENENMRISQVVETYPVSKASIWRYVKDGKLNSYKITRGVTVFRRSELEEFFNGDATLEKYNNNLYKSK